MLKAGSRRLCKKRQNFPSDASTKKGPSLNWRAFFVGCPAPYGSEKTDWNLVLD